MRAVTGVLALLGNESSGHGREAVRIAGRHLAKRVEPELGPSSQKSVRKASESWGAPAAYEVSCRGVGAAPGAGFEGSLFTRWQGAPSSSPSALALFVQLCAHVRFEPDHDPAGLW